MTPPRTQVAALAFDKLDAEKGMEVKGPAGELRWLRNPWSVLAFQIAGAEGLRLLHADGLDAERESAPPRTCWSICCRSPMKHDLSTLILIDEVLMYARDKIGLDPHGESRLMNFFQYLTQAATKIERCAIVASLLASEPSKSDTLGKEIASELSTIFRREREEGIQPVLKEDVAEILRRRFFVPESIKDREAFRPHVVAALKGMADHDELDREGGQARRGAVPQELPVPSRPDGGPLYQVDPARRLPADTRGVADVCAGAAGCRRLGPVPADRGERVPERAGQGRGFSSGAGTDQRRRQRGIRRQEAGLDGHP